PEGQVINNVASTLDSDSENLTGNVQLTWRKRLSENGRSLVFSARGVLNDRESSSELDGLIAAPGRGGPSRGDALTSEEVRQLQQQDTRGYTESQRLALTQPLGGSRVLELYAQRRSVGDDQTQSVFDLRSGSPVFDDALSSRLDQRYGYLNGGFRLSRNTERTFLTLGTEYQRSTLDGRIPEAQERIRRDFHFLLPNANFRYEIRDGWTLNARYAASAREPDTRDLQPFVDNTDPLNVYVGNPELQPETRHTLQLAQRWFDQFTFRNVFAYARFAYQQDAIRQARVVDERGVQTVTPVNTDDAWTLNSGIDFSTPIRRIGADVELGYDLTWSREQQLLNLQDNETTIVRNGVSLSVENRRKGTFDVEAGVDLNFNDVRYSLSEQQNRSYLNTTLRADAEWYPAEEWTLATSLRQQFFDEEVFGPGQDVTLWQASASRLFMDGRGELELTAFDLLDQNQGVAFVNAANFVQESRTNTLGRHLIVRFVWRIGQVPGGRGRGEMRRLR
ncbi:MAG: TonB-dependent receptor domain-containing protein, partial [Gemmatimonadota bacterium]